MRTGTVPRLAVVTVAAVGMYVPTLGLPLPGSCLRTGAGASAAPSPTCSSDLRECLRISADMRPTTFGVRYVTADDVAKCMEKFTSCTHGGAAGGGNAGPPATPTRGRAGGLPDRFTVTIEGVVDDCRRNGDSFTCTTTLAQLPAGMDTFAGTFTGSVSGWTLTGTRSYKDSGHQTTDPSCTWEMQSTDPATVTLSPDGSASMKQGPGRTRESAGGSCNGTGEFETPASQSTGTWSPRG